MRKIALLGLLCLAACATVAQTPAQKFFAARASYNVVLGAAVDYAETPTANKSIVEAVKTIRDATQPSVDYADAYVACRVEGMTSVAVGRTRDVVPCSTFTFTNASISSTILVLRDATLRIKSARGSQ